MFSIKFQVRIGMVTVSDGKCKPQPMRLHLTTELLKLQKEQTSSNPVPVPVVKETLPDSRVSKTNLCHLCDSFISVILATLFPVCKQSTVHLCRIGDIFPWFTSACNIVHISLFFFYSSCFSGADCPCEKKEWNRTRAEYQRWFRAQVTYHDFQDFSSASSWRDQTVVCRRCYYQRWAKTLLTTEL